MTRRASKWSPLLPAERMNLLGLSLGALLLVGCVESRPLFNQDNDDWMAWQDCDDQAPEVGPRYRDLDGDGYGAGPWDAGCSASDEVGYSPYGTDCNDQDADVGPAVLETCDDKDNDCDGLIDDNLEGTPPPELTCNFRDDNCNGNDDELPDLDDDGFVVCSEAPGVSLDCDDTDPNINPAELETLGDLLDTDCNGSADHIATTFGNGMCCFDGDELDAAFATLGNPGQLLLDRAGNLLFADPGSHRIRKISSKGIVSTLAGNGIAGFDGDNGVATSASLNGPSGLAIDSQGNLYIADTYNHVVRKVQSDNRIVTVLGVPEDAGSSLIKDEPLKSELNQPTAVLLDSDDNLLVADKLNHRILQLKVAANQVVRLIGTGVAGSAGDGGAAAEAQLNGPVALLYRPDRQLLISDSFNHAVRLVDNLGVISTYVGTRKQGYAGDGGPRTQAMLNTPGGLALDDRSQLFLADQLNHRVRLVTPDGIITTIAGAGSPGFSGDGGVARDAMLNTPFGLLIDEAGYLIVGDTLNHRLRTVTW